MTSFREWPSDGGPHTADSIGQAFAGMVARDAAGNPVPGMLAAPTVTAVPSAWKVQVGRFVYVRNVAGAARFSGLSASEQVDIANASTIPGGQARIDLIVWDPADGELAVIAGTPGTSPSVPPAGGMEPVATVRVNAGDASVIGGQVTPVFGVAKLAGSGRVASGVVAARVVVAHGDVRVPVVFPAGMFSEPPNVQVTHFGSGTNTRDTTAGFDSLTKDGMTVVLGSNSAATRTIGAHWRVEQL